MNYVLANWTAAEREHLPACDRAVAPCEAVLRDGIERAMNQIKRNSMPIHLRPADLNDVAFLADVVIAATLEQDRFPLDVDVAEYRAGYEDWTRANIMGAVPDCILSVI